MSDVIRILVADDSSDTRFNLKRLLQFDSELEIVGEAADGQEVMEKADELLPDCILMDVNMPGTDGLSATEQIVAKHPQMAVIIISVQGESEYLRRAMAVGARDYLVKPFTLDELLETIRRVVQRVRQEQSAHMNRQAEVPKKAAELITVFSAKGGVGKTTIATNLAVALAEMKQKVALLDFDLQFGDVSIALDLAPRLTIVDMVRESGWTSGEALSYLTEHSSSLSVLAAPLQPEQADLIEGSHVKNILGALLPHFDYIVIDTAQNFTDVTLTALDESDLILLVSTQDLPTLKNVMLSSSVMQSLHYPPEKIRLVVNRENSKVGLSVSMLEDKLGMSVSYRIPFDGKLVVESMNQGIPVVCQAPKSAIAQGFRKMAADIAGVKAAGLKTKRRMLWPHFAWLANRNKRRLERCHS